MEADENWTLHRKYFKVYLRNPKPSQPDYVLTYRLEYSRDDPSHYINLEKIPKSASVEREVMTSSFTPSISRNQLHPIVNLLRTRFQVAKDNQLDIWRDEKLAENFAALVNTDVRFGQMLQHDLYPTFSERRKFVPYFKLAVYYHPGKGMFETEGSVFATIYMADLLLRRLGIRLLVTSVNDLDTLKGPTIANEGTVSITLNEHSLSIIHVRLINLISPHFK